MLEINLLEKKTPRGIWKLSSLGQLVASDYFDDGWDEDKHYNFNWEEVVNNYLLF